MTKQLVKFKIFSMKMTGTKIIKIWILIAAIGMITIRSKGQEIGFSFLAYPSAGYNLVMEPGMNGAGASFFYNRTKYDQLNLSLSAEYAMTTWGHQVFSGIGINRTWISWERFELNTFAHLLNGLALHKPKSLYVFGVDTRMGANYYWYNDIKFFIAAGIRYTLSPGYKSYGIVETSLDIPVQFGMKFLLGR